MEHNEIKIIPDGSLERFIPIRRKDIIDGLIARAELDSNEQKMFQDFCQLLAGLYHYNFHSYLETLKDYYLPFSPDSDVQLVRQLSAAEMSKSHNALAENMRNLVEKANYEQITNEDLLVLMNEGSAFGVEVEIDMEDFAELVLYYRGSATKVEQKRTLKSFFLKKEDFTTPVYKRLFFLVQFKKEEEQIKELIEKQGFTEKKATNKVKKSRANLPADISDNHVFLKLFKNIPRSDIATLFPNQTIKLKRWDKIRFAVTGGGGTLASIIGALTKLLASPISAVIAIVGLGGVIFRQVMNVFNQRTRYMAVLSQNLYFHNLSNNFGVITTLIDMAEEEESKEAVLAYYFLLKFPEKQYTMEKLDQEIEAYLKEKYSIDLDFEVEDGLRKLQVEGLIQEDSNGILSVTPLDEACKILDGKWDKIFEYAN